MAEIAKIIVRATGGKLLKPFIRFMKMVTCEAVILLIDRDAAIQFLSDQVRELILAFW